MRYRLLLVSIAFTGALAGACAPAVDVAKGVQVADVSTGWVDATAPAGTNKIVPSVSFTLKNVSDRTLPALQINAVFRRAHEPQEWGNGFRAVPAARGVAPGRATDRVTISAQLGYTGTDPHEALLQNSQFVDATVDLFARAGSAQWTRIGEYPIARQLMAP